VDKQNKSKQFQFSKLCNTDITIPGLFFTQLDKTYGWAKKQDSTLSKSLTPTGPKSSLVGVGKIMIK
jgi:hypothetical protein